MAALDPTWYDYREVACPHCQARAGTYCQRPSGHSGPFVQPHQERRQVAHRQWEQEELTRFGRLITTWDDEPALTETPAAPAPAPPAPPQQLSLF